MAQLEVIDGFNIGEKYVLTQNMSIGRSLDNNISLPDGRASRKHARIFQENGTFFIEDLKSANGTMIQATMIQPQTPTPIHHGNEVQICSTRMRFVDESEAASAPPKVAAQQDFGSLSVCMAPEEDEKGFGPEVNLTIDAQQSMADIAVTEASSESEIQGALKRLQAICKVSSALGKVMDQNALMQKIMDCIFDIFPTAERAFIMLKEQDSDQLVPVAARRRVEVPGVQEDVAISRTIVKDVITNKRSILSSDAQSDDRFSNQMSIMNLSIRSMMCAPLLVEDEILGLIQVDSASGVQSFTQEDLPILTGVSAQAAIAVKNAILLTAVEDETARRTSLQQYFSPKMVEMMMNGEVDTKLGGQSYIGTVFFSDIIGFTCMSESMPAEQVVANLNRYFTVMQKILYDNGGNVDKFGGDAIMAFWSVPHHDEKDEYHAILTGVQMQANLWPFNLELEADNQTTIHMGIGINTGAFVAGNIGSEDKIEFTLIGDNVNLAARIEAKAGRWQVFASESTLQPAKTALAVIELPPVEVKGKSEPITIYSVRLVQVGENECAIAIPVDISNPGGQKIGSGILTGTWNIGPDQRLLLNTSEELALNTEIYLTLEMPEYHEIFTLRATVSTASSTSQGGRATYNRVVLSNLQGEGALNFLRPNVCLKTEQPWENIQRGS